MAEIIFHQNLITFGKATISFFFLMDTVDFRFYTIHNLQGTFHRGCNLLYKFTYKTAYNHPLSGRLIKFRSHSNVYYLNKK